MKAALSRDASPRAPEKSSVSTAAREPSIDVIRGLAMVFMALDHSRDYFTSLPFDPELLSKTYPALFLTRWITHFCAPAFFLLAGMGAYFYGFRHGLPKLQLFLCTRGLVLILMEFLVVGTAWTFQFPAGFFGVIWSLGSSMLVLGLVARFDARLIGAAAVTIIALHDLTDMVRPSQFGGWAAAWSLLHVKGSVHWGPIDSFVLFPLVPWVAVMGAGYWVGTLYFIAPSERAKFLRLLGYACILGFIGLRLSNVYGNPPVGFGGVTQGDWHPQPTLAKTFILFLDVEKYPPSLQYLLMTIGPVLLLLGSLSRYRPRASNPLLIFGRVPLFFYVCHLFLIHGLAVGVAYLYHQPMRWLLHGAFFRFDLPAGYGHGLPFVYFMWLLVLALMYLPCAWFARKKQAGQSRWLSYF